MLPDSACRTISSSLMASKSSAEIVVSSAGSPRPARVAMAEAVVVASPVRMLTLMWAPVRAAAIASGTWSRTGSIIDTVPSSVMCRSTAAITA